MSKTKKRIDEILEQRQSSGFRRHLGASLIGKDCPRYIWYVFRWAKRTRASARMLRLWARGHEEENRIIKWLRDSGTHVESLDPITRKQFRVTDHNDHFGGSLDAKLYDAPDFPGLWILGEFKTWADKYFKALKSAINKHGPQKGLKETSVTYYVQSNIYMHYTDLPNCLHFNINKNDDDLEIISLTYDAETAERYIDRAYRIINAEVPPPRISESPGWYLCNMCDMRQICHFGAPKEKNCRTCVHSAPIQEGQWLCTKFSYVLSEAEQRMGCQVHTPIPE